MKVGFVFDDSLDKTDGVQQYVLALGQWLTLQGHEVHYLVGQTVRQDIPYIHSLSKNINVRFNGNRMSIPLPASKKKIANLLESEQFDILHVQMPYSPFMAHRVIQAAPVNTVIVGTFHVAPISGTMTIGTKILSSLVHSTVKRFKIFLSVSVAAQQFAKQTYGIESEILPNVVDYKRFHNAKPFAEYANGTLTVLFFGRLVPRKGCQILLEAVNVLIQDTFSLPKFRVIVCGTGPLEPSLKQYVADHNLEEYVNFTGYVQEKDKPRYYASSDISVFPSNGGESFGIVLLEAMASGHAAILGGRNSGYAAVLADMPDTLFNPHSPTELGDKLRHLMVDVTARKNTAAWGNNYAREFDTATVGNKLLAIYKQALRLPNNMR